jgi:flavin reductase (DIM6/NTAB) family NADH-FMN oxidoreductase RutF
MKIVSEIVYPRQVILVTSRANVKSRFFKDTKVKDNIFALSWHMPVSSEPELYAISVSPKRFSYQLIMDSKVFVVNFMPYKCKDAVMYCGSHRGELIDKFREAGLKKEEAESIDCPRIKEADGYLECEVVNHIDAGDHVIIVGKVLKAIKKHNSPRLFHTREGFVTTQKKVKKK